MNHREVEDKHFVGWQPVFSTSQQKQFSGTQGSFGMLWGMCLMVTIVCIGVSGGFLWTRAQKSDTELEAKIQNALQRQQDEIIECITTPKKGEMHTPEPTTVQR